MSTEMEFLDISLIKYSSLLLNEIQSPFYRRILLRKPYSTLVLNVVWSLWSVDYTKRIENEYRDGILGHQFDKILESFVLCNSQCFLQAYFTENHVYSALVLKTIQKNAIQENIAIQYKRAVPLNLPFAVASGYRPLWRLSRVPWEGRMSISAAFHLADMTGG
jgi:hypothetical protein